MQQLMTTKKIRISVYLEESLKEKLEKLARANKRSVSNLIEASMEEIVKQALKSGEIEE
jgi:predicted transcriptional regulator